MKMNKKHVFFILVCLLLWVSGVNAQSVIDGATFDSYKLSARTIYEELSGNKQQLFSKAARYYEAMFEWGAEEGVQNPDIMERTDKIRQALSGKTADALIDSYIMVVEENYAMAKTELDEAQKYIANAKKMNEAVNGFEIMDSKFYYDESQENAVPMIGLSVHNGTTSTITYLYLRAKVYSPGRVIPWFEDEFNFGVAEGVKPNDTADWELVTDVANGWDSIPKRDDLAISIEVVKLITAKGQELNVYPLPDNHEAYIKMLNDQIKVFSDELAELKKLVN